MYRRTLAIVPTQCRSSGPGRSTSGLLCSSTPSGRCERAASCAAARELSRPMVTGRITPGNSTKLRTGRMMSASSGKGRETASPPGLASTSTGCAGIPASATTSGLFISSLIVVWLPDLAQAQRKAPVCPLPRARLQRYGRQRNFSLEAPVRDFETADLAMRPSEHDAALRADYQRSRFDRHFDAFGRDARHGNDDHDFAVVLEHVDGRLPHRACALGSAQSKELPMHALGLLEQLAGFG